ncbi:VOC family protein [Desulfonatronum thioautotrophicum]|uniref:VOC family protein n=1 Tax=Desulfonatronum thioautotrophicum TaxID=617001 RepID=UPI0005EAF2EA|nr:VOC family protein [Desulfonatronum thioautotrophicum]
MAECIIDHIAVTASTLEEGVRFIQETLGVAPEPGGEHPQMGTHNMLLRLGEMCYLEVIAQDPHARAPERPRWFGLDELRADAAPQISAWIARTTDIHSAVDSSTEDLGSIETMHRGHLQWLITIAPNGRVPLDGVGPAIIEWPPDVHPAAKLHDHGLSLIELQLIHPDPARVTRLLKSLSISGPLTVRSPAPGTTPRLRAVVDTPHGTRVLSVAEK